MTKLRQKLGILKSCNLKFNAYDFSASLNEFMKSHFVCFLFISCARLRFYSPLSFTHLFIATWTIHSSTSSFSLYLCKIVGGVDLKTVLLISRSSEIKYNIWFVKCIRNMNFLSIISFIFYCIAVVVLPVTSQSIQCHPESNPVYDGKYNSISMIDFFILTCFRISWWPGKPICEGDYELGMTDYRIPDSSLTSSTSFDAKETGPHSGRYCMTCIVSHR